MTEFRSDLDQKYLHRQTLLLEHDRNSRQRQTLTLPPKKYVGAVSLERSPSLASRVALHLYMKENIRHGDQEDPGCKIKVC